MTDLPILTPKYKGKFNDGDATKIIMMNFNITLLLIYYLLQNPRLLTMSFSNNDNSIDRKIYPQTT